MRRITVSSGDDFLIADEGCDVELNTDHLINQCKQCGRSRMWIFHEKLPIRFTILPTDETTMPPTELDYLKQRIAELESDLAGQVELAKLHNQTADSADFLRAKAETRTREVEGLIADMYNKMLCERKRAEHAEERVREGQIELSALRNLLADRTMERDNVEVAYSALREQIDKGKAKIIPIEQEKGTFAPEGKGE